MKLTVAGKDRSQDIGTELEQVAASRPDSGLVGLLNGESAVLTLKNAPDEAEYLARHVEIMQSRHSVDPLLVSIPAGRGWIGRCLCRIRMALWKLLFPFQNELVFRQNTINRMLIHHLYIEHQMRVKAARELEQRLSSLEQKAGPAVRKEKPL